MCKNEATFELPTFEKIPHDYDINVHKDILESYSEDEFGFLKRYYSVYSAKAKPNSKFSDQIIYVSPNDISLITLATDHPLIELLRTDVNLIRSVTIEAMDNLKNNEVKGKRKKGASEVLPWDPLLKISVTYKKAEDEIPEVKEYFVAACLPAKVLELNTKTVEEPTPEMFLGIQNYLAVLMPSVEPKILTEDPRNLDASIDISILEKELLEKKLETLPKKISKTNGEPLPDSKSFLSKVRAQIRQSINRSFNVDCPTLSLLVAIRKFGDEEAQ